MLKLYTEPDFELLCSWVTDSELLMRFSGTDFSFPITKEQIFSYQKRYPDRKFYIGYTSNNIPYAFGEIIPQQSGVPRLGRILVGEPVLRGRGLGKYFVSLLIDECIERFNSDTVELLCWDKNYAAIRCYQSLGFVYEPVKLRSLIHEGSTYDIIKMTYTN